MLKNNKKIILVLSLFMILMIGVIGTNFVFNKFSWHNIQDLSFEGGRGQERVAQEFEIDSINCGGAGSVYDDITNLCWEKNSSTPKINWNVANNYCNDLTIAGGNWRLPDKIELMTLLNNSGFSVTNIALNNIGFNNIKNDGYWSNTKFNSSHIYVVNFMFGMAGKDISTITYYTLCVKNPN